MIDFRLLSDVWWRSPVTVRDLPFGLALAVVSLMPTLQGDGTQFGGLPTRPYDAPAVLAVALQCLPLAVRRRWPAVCLALVSIGFALDQLRGYHTLGGTGLLVALMSAGAHLERHRRVTAALASVAFAALVVTFSLIGPGETPTEVVVFYLVLALAWRVGHWLRTARAAEAERRRHVAEATRAAERTRIARELHDVVTHHVTAMVVQAEAARYLTADPDRLDEALASVGEAGRRAITDLRHLLDLLNPDHEADVRSPAIGDLRTLVEHTRQAGQPVEFTEEGTPPDSAGGAESVAYRVVQESLTNALKYAYGSRTVVHVRYDEGEITVEVGTDAPSTRTRSPGGSGRGLTGLGERVAALGGEFSADRRDDGGFAVTARIPAGGAS
ncbi:histidine kinase [Thermopolyspora sp. NPDC052614]|uniref:sensor histidine kinase n=1 Tax=Thermopolyspora sp. NPDC052614 TaxID=3155682 RepID=UPI003422592B